MNFVVEAFLCNFLGFRQFTVDSSENNTEITEIDSRFFLILHSTFGIYIGRIVT